MLVPRVQPAAEQGVERLEAAGDRFPEVGGLVFGGDEAGEDLDPAPPDGVVVEARPEVAAPHLDDLEPPPHSPVIGRVPLHADDAVGDAVQVRVAHVAGLVVDEQDRAVASGEELLEGEDLAAVAERVLRQQPQLGHRVEHQPGRPGLLGLGEDGLDRLAKLDLGGVVHRVPGVGLEAFLGGDDLDDLDALQRPAVGRGRGPEFLLALGEGDEQAGFAEPGALP